MSFAVYEVCDTALTAV